MEKYATEELLYLLAIDEEGDDFEDIMDYPEIRGDMSEYEGYEYDTLPAKLKEQEGWD